MNQMKKQLLTAVMAFAIAASCTAPAFAADTAVSPAGSASSATEIMPRSKRYTVVSRKAPLYKTASLDGTIIIELFCNDTVLGMGKTQSADGYDWLYVMSNDGDLGWILKKDVVLIG